MARHRLLMAASLALLALAGPTVSAQWPQFRGSRAGEVPDDPALPDTWSETINVVWKTDIPGAGWSSPVVWDDHVFVTSSVSPVAEPRAIKGLYDPGDENGKTRSTAEHRWMVYGIDFKTGKIRW